MTSAVALPNHIVLDKLNNAELTSSKGLLMYQCACSLGMCNYKNMHTMYLFHWPLTSKQERCEPGCHYGGKLQVLLPELALLAFHSDSCSELHNAKLLSS